MNRSYICFAFLCFCALSGSVLGNPIIEAKAGLEIVKEGIDTLDNGFKMYNKVLDKVVPWSELSKRLEKLDEFRSDYSKEAAALIGEIQTKILDGMDAYKRAVRIIYEWCGVAVDLLDTYGKLLNGEMNQEKFKASRTVLLQVLNSGINKMTVGQKELGDSSASFDNAIETLTQLNRQLKVDFDKNSEYYQSQVNHIRAVGYGAAAPFMLLGLSVAAGVVEGKLIPELKEKISQLNTNMASIQKWLNEITADVENVSKNAEDTRVKLQEEIDRIGDVKTQTEARNTYVELDHNAELKEAILTSVADLITECNKYRARHIDGK